MFACRCAPRSASWHEKGIAHVDVSPYNILVREKGAAYVLNDMGLSVKLEASHVKFAISAQSN
jgi:RIO-like serine/threonine protein kinase